MTQIAFQLYHGMTALAAVGPYEVLARLPGADVKFVATTPGPINTDVGEVEARALRLVIEHDPDPPFDSGSFETADPETKRRATAHMVPGSEHAQAPA